MAIRIIKAVTAILLMGWVIFQALHMEARQSTPDWDSLNASGRWDLAWSVGAQGILHRFQSVSTGFFLLSLLCVGVTILAGVFRWKAFLGNLGCATKFRDLFSVTMAGYFFNSFMLGATGGDVVKAYYTSRLNPDRKEASVTAVFMDRLFGLVFMLCFAALAIIPLARWISQREELSQLGVKVLWLALVAVILLILSYGLFMLMGRIRVSLPEWAAGRLRKIRQAIGMTLTSPRLLGQAVLWSLVINAFCILQIQFLALGLGIEVEPVYLAFAVPVIITISSIPLTPSGFGIRENLYVYLLALAATPVGAGEALALSLLAYAGTFIWNLAGGIFFLFLKAEIPQTPDSAGPDE